MRYPLRLLIVLAALAGLVVLGLRWARPEPVEVVLHAIDRGPVEASVANTRVGTVKACRRAYLAPMAAGQVAVLAVREGDEVSTGQVLLEIWNADLKAQIAHAQAEAAAARARVGEACTSAAGAEREAARLKRLVAQQLVSEDNADVADTSARAKRSACQAAVATTVVSDARIEATRAALERTLVRAPFPGTIAEVNAELGGYVTPSPQGIQTLPAIDLLDVSCLYVSAPIDEVDAPAIKIGMRACVRLDAFPDQRCNGVVRRVAPYVLDAEKQARTVEVEVELRDPKDLADLLPGYSADIEVTLETRESVVRVPSEAVIDSRYVFVFDPATGTISRREFKPGIANWRYTEVVDGLTAGAVVVLSVGREGVRDGAHVKAAPDAADAQ